MADRIKVIIKRPDETYGHVTYIANVLKTFQNHVDGYIEAVPLTHNSVIICNEEGKIKELKPNFSYGTLDTICGTVIVCGTEGEEFTDVPFEFVTWKKLLKAWGN